jgi:hypothetical protein
VPIAKAAIWLKMGGLEIAQVWDFGRFRAFLAIRLGSQIILARYDNLCDPLVLVQFERKIHICLVN